MLSFAGSLLSKVSESSPTKTELKRRPAEFPRPWGVRLRPCLPLLDRKWALSRCAGLREGRATPGQLFQPRRLVSRYNQVFLYLRTLS